MSNTKTIEAYVAKIIFYNSDNNFYILATVCAGEDLTISGNFINVEENNEYHFEGDYFDHPKYGHQFKAFHALLLLPTEEDLVVSFLSGPNFSGVGPVMAQKIYECYQEYDKILEAIIANPEQLMNIKGFTQTKKENVIKGINEHTQDNGLFEYLSKYQVDYQSVVKVFNKAGLDVNEFISVLAKDPYLLMAKQIGFKEIDKFASQLELESFEYLRFKGSLFSIIKTTSFKRGSTYIEAAELFTMISPNYKIDLSQELYEKALDDLTTDGLIVNENNNIYEYQQYDSENFIAEFVNEFGQIKDNTEIDDYLDEYEQYHGISFNNEQRAAIFNGINCPISIITGGPGTGKSTIVDALIYVIRKLDKRQLIGLCAPTGKASKRLSILTSEKSMTIHKMLKYDMHSNSFSHNIFNPLDYDVLIIDEASMIDNLLMANLLKACFNVKKIIILGDYNQLPSVSEGQVLRDLIESKAMYVSYLKEIYRQLEGSKIIDLAYEVLSKTTLKTDVFDEQELVLVDINDVKKINDILKEYVAYPDKSEIQILAPMYRGRFGIDNINKNIQKLIYGVDFDPINLNDRLIQLKNRNDDEIYNGDIGIVKSLANNKVTVQYDSKEIIYNKAELHELYLAYCISIHKAQGNEYNEVILFLPNFQTSFMDNKILYTAITRTKKKLIIVSDLFSLNEAVVNDGNDYRQTYLKKRINKS